MTIASEVNKSGPYFYNGATTSFPYGFKIDDEAHIRAVETVTATGAETDLVLGVDYTVTGVGDDTGNVVISPARAAGKSVTLVRKVPFTQNLDLQNQGAYFAESVEDALDRAVARDQQLQEQVSRAVVVPISTDPTDLEALGIQLVALLGIVDDVATVGAIASDVSAVAAIGDDVTTVSGLATEVAALGPVSGDISDVAAISASVTTVAAISSDVTTVAGVASGVAALGPISSDVSEVALIAADVTAVADNMVAIQGASANAATASAAAVTATGAAGEAVDAKEAVEALYGDLSAITQAKNDAVAAAEAAGVDHWADTKAGAEAALGGYAEGDVIGVFADESKDGAQVFYRVESGALVEKIDADARVITVIQHRDRSTIAHIFDFVTAGQQNAIINGTSDYDISGDLQTADDQAEGARIIFPSGRFIVAGTVNKDCRTVWDGVVANRSAGGRGTLLEGAFDGPIISIAGDGVNRRAAIRGLRLINQSKVTYPNAKGIYAHTDMRDHLFQDIYIGNFDVNMEFDGGKAGYLERVYSFGAISHGCRVHAAATDFWFRESQFDGGIFGLFLDGSDGALASMHVLGCRPQVSGVANFCADNVSYLTVLGGFNDTAIGTGGAGAIIKNCLDWKYHGVQSYANGDDQPHLLIDSDVGEICLDGSVLGNTFKKSGSNTGTVSAIKFGANAGTTRRITIDHNNMSDVDQSIVFDTVTGTLDTVTIGAGNILNATTPIVNADAVASKLRIGDCEGAIMYASYISRTTALVLTADAAPTQRFAGEMNTSFNVDLPTRGNYPGKRLRFVRQDGGSGIITLRNNGATALHELKEAGQWVEVEAIGTGTTFVVTASDGQPRDEVVLYASYASRATDLVLAADAARTQRFTGAINTSFNVDLPTEDNYAGRRIRLIRQDGGPGVITIRYNGTTQVHQLTAQGQWVDVEAIGIGTTWVETASDSLAR